jgi:hypothetical protein
MKIDKKYYVASRKMHPGTISHNTWAKETLQEAIEHATEQCTDSGEMQMVVKIIMVVKPAPPPVIVEEVE